MDESRNLKPDWQLSCEKTRERLSHLLNTNLWSDCTFLVGEEEPETVAAHKFVLAMSSPVFETMFYGSMPEDKGPIRVLDVPPQAFRIMLKFLYTDEAKIGSYREACEVYCAARKYMVPFIQTRCLTHLLYNLVPSNACFAHEFATLFDEKILLNASLKTFKRKTKEILKDGSFYEAPVSTVTALFSLQELDIDSEMDLFNALEKYAAETMGIAKLKRSFDNDKKRKESPAKRPRVDGNDSQSQVDESSETDSKMESDEPNEDEKKLISEIRLALSHIRFLTLSAQAFAPAARSVLLTDEEALAIMLNIAGVNMPLPAPLTDTKVPRRIREWSPDCGTSSASTSTDQTPPAGQNQKVPSSPQYEGMCTFKVLNLKMRKRSMRSQPFRTDIMEWCINIVLGSETLPSGLDRRTLGVLIECTGPQETNPGGWSCNARVAIQLIHPNRTDHLQRSFTTTYDKASPSHGYRNLVPFETVLEHYLQGGAITVIVRVATTFTT